MTFRKPRKGEDAGPPLHTVALVPKLLEFMEADFGEVDLNISCAATHSNICMLAKRIALSYLGHCTAFGVSFRFPGINQTQGLGPVQSNRLQHCNNQY